MNYGFIYAGLIVLVMLLYLRRQQRTHLRNVRKLEKSLASGFHEPASLHPIIDPTRCIGSGTCAKACPEDALGLINGKMVLKNASACIGHGTCRQACPVDAITLVFGSAKRGVDIPSVSSEFESNVPGIFIAGELGGMGLIHKAAQQGRAAIRAIRKSIQAGPGYDVVIVGSGPAGLSAGLSALHHGLRYLLIEQEDTLGGAIAHYPRQKITMTSSIELDMVGKVNFGQIPKEQLVKFWKETVVATGLKISFRECLQSIDKIDKGFVVHTSGGQHHTKTVLLALGRQGTPRKLDVPGENSPKVTYRLVDAAQYAGKTVLVVGGGDSALEAAIALSQIDSISVTLVHRSEAFTRVKSRNRELLAKQAANQRVQVVMQTDVKQIDAHQVLLDVAGTSKTLSCDAIIVCADGPSRKNRHRISD